MTFSEVQAKIIRRWWIVLLVSIIATLVLFPWAKSASYKAGITVGLSFNSLKFNSNQSNSSDSLAYVTSFADFALYLESRFSSIEIQDFISTKANLKVKTLNEKTPFYTVNKGSGGFVGLSYSDDNKENVEGFLSAVPEAYKEIVSEWNDSRLDTYQIKPMENFTKTIVVVEKPPQIQALPAVLGWLLGILISVAMPNKWII